jgi:hypothetical protein
MKKYIALSVVLVAFTFFSCGNEKKKTEPEIIEVETAEAPTEYTAENTDVSFTDGKMADVFKQYIQLKTALVNTDAEKASAEATILRDIFVKIEASEATITAAQNLAESKDVEVQRTAFVRVTSAVEQLMEGALSSGTIYKQYCPMAFGNTGASWLSESKEIYNPYFGDKMLRCGRVQAEIK